jgi:hypothetical protein
MVWSLATQLPAPHEAVVLRGHQVNYEFRSLTVTGVVVVVAYPPPQPQP